MPRIDVRFRLRVLLYRSDEGAWIAQALEKDIAAQGATLTEARTAFLRELTNSVIVGAEHGDANLTNVPAAPQRFWKSWQTSAELRHPLPTDLPEPPPAWVIDALSEVRVAG